MHLEIDDRFGLCPDDKLLRRWSRIKGVRQVIWNFYTGVRIDVDPEKVDELVEKIGRDIEETIRIVR